jgi:hypothetical protein
MDRCCINYHTQRVFDPMANDFRVNVWNSNGAHASRRTWVHECPRIENTNHQETWQIGIDTVFPETPEEPNEARYLRGNFSIWTQNLRAQGYFTDPFFEVLHPTPGGTFTWPDIWGEIDESTSESPSFIIEEQGENYYLSILNELRRPPVNHIGLPPLGAIVDLLPGGGSGA